MDFSFVMYPQSLSETAVTITISESDDSIIITRVDIYCLCFNTTQPVAPLQFYVFLDDRIYRNTYFRFIILV